MKKFVLLGCVCGLTACGGGGGEINANYSVVRAFSDGSGVGRAHGTSGDDTAVLYFITPEVVAAVNSANTDSSTVGPDIDPQNFPLISQRSGYDFRQGFIEGASVTVVSKTGEVDDTDNVVFYFDIEGESLIMAGVDGLTGTPTGEMTYVGLYSVEDSRYVDWLEIGDLNLTANFDTKRFSINASSDVTSLAGSGYLDTNSGQISSVDLTLSDSFENETRDASLLGSLGGQNASTVAAIWHTNENTPVYKGAIIGDKE